MFRETLPTKRSSFLTEKLVIANRGKRSTSESHAHLAGPSGRSSFLDEKLAIANRRPGKKKAGEFTHERHANAAMSSASENVALDLCHSSEGGRQRQVEAEFSGLDDSDHLSMNDQTSGMASRGQQNPNVPRLEKGMDVIYCSEVAPGAEAVAGFSVPGDSQIMYNMDSKRSLPVDPTYEEEGQLLVANLVDEPGIALPINLKRRRVTIGCIMFLLAVLVATVTSIAVVYTRPGGKSVTPSPTASLEPSASPSSFPSTSPSTNLFGFLAAYSFDGGLALSKEGSPQQKAMYWLVKSSGLVTMNYQLLQNYALATLYYATFGTQWSSSVFYNLQRLSGNPDSSVDFSKDWLSTDLGSCKWQGVSCNQEGAITSLQLCSNHLYGSIPAEMAMLAQSLSKYPGKPLASFPLLALTSRPLFLQALLT